MRECLQITLDPVCICQRPIPQDVVHVWIGEEESNTLDGVAFVTLPSCAKHLLAGFHHCVEIDAGISCIELWHFNVLLSFFSLVKYNTQSLKELMWSNFKGLFFVV